MNIRDAKLEVIHTIQAYTAKNEWGGYVIPALRQRPLLLIGPPGIGKTAIMAAAAAECGVSFLAYTMTHHTRQSALGLPYIEKQQFGGQEYTVTEYTMSEIIASVYRTVEESGIQEGLLFLDEINCVSETLAPAMLQFLQTKTFGGHRLPEGWVLAAAGNPPEYNKSVREFDIATLDRLKYITVEADYKAWRSYALEAGIHGAILSYLDTHPENFYVLSQTYGTRSFATARGWEDLSCILFEYEALSIPVNAALVLQYVQAEDLARDFEGYYHWYRSKQFGLPVAEMLSGDENAAKACRELLAAASFDEQLHLIHLILSALGALLHTYEQQKRQKTLLAELSDRLCRYQKQQKLSSPGEALRSFLENERNVLKIRLEHGLSPENEIEETRQALYRLQEAFYQMASRKSLDSSHDPDSAVSFCEQLAADTARQLSIEINNGISMLVNADPAIFTLFLSSLTENPLMAEFLLTHRNELYEHWKERLDFRQREEALRKKIVNAAAAP